MIAVIFEVFPKNMDDYMDIAAAMRPLAEGVEGFISVERFQSMTNPEKYLSVSYFERRSGGGAVAQCGGTPPSPSTRTRKSVHRLPHLRLPSATRLHIE